MNSENLFDLLERFAEIERLVSKIYFRFSHLFLHQPELRDVWWEMANEEDQHGSILLRARQSSRIARKKAWIRPLAEKGGRAENVAASLLQPGDTVARR
jgi:hypothetical protein